MAIVVASLATIGTSASPTPPPSLSSDATGEFLLSADAPIASVEIEVAANAALRSDPTSQTIVRVARTSQAGAVQAEPVVLAIQPLEPAGAGATIASWPQFQSFVDEGCQPAAACTRRYRITAALVDPGAIEEPIAVAWSAVAENRTGTPDKPVQLRPDATLELTAGEAVSAPAANLVTAALPSDSRRLDAANPRFSQVVTITRPQGAGVFGGPLFGAMLRATFVRDDPNAFSGEADVRVEDLEGNPVSRGYDAGTQGLELLACEDEGGCSTDLRVVGEWDGGAANSGVMVDWSLAAAVFVADADGPAPAPGSVAIGGGDLVAAPLQPAGDTTGELVVGGDGQVRRNVTVAIDRDVLSGDADGALFVQATLTATTTSRSGTAGPVRISVGRASVGAEDGSDLTAVTRVMPADCSTGVCHVIFPIGANAYDHPDGDLRVAWRLSVALLAEPPVAVEPGATVTFDVVELP